MKTTRNKWYEAIGSGRISTKKLTLPITVILFLLCFPAILAAGPTFLHPPEVNISGWITPYPYQRNIYWDFSTGTTPVYYGNEDAALKGIDTVTLTGAFSWDSGEGAIGIDNSSGTGSAIGTAVFHLGNLSQANPTKYFYVEFGSFGKGDVSALFPIDVPVGFNVDYANGGWVFSTTNLNTNGTFEWNAGIYETIHPNPTWEEFRIDMVAHAGEYIWFDYMHIATDCAAPVPEPATMLLLGLGLIGLAEVRRKLSR